MCGRYVRTHLSDQTLLRDLAERLARERGNTAELLADLAEVDARRLYAQAGYPSMHAYCVHELLLSEDAASKRIQAARKAREFPAIFEAVADGRLHLSAVCLLAPYLTPENADELLAAAAHQSKAHISRCLAERFPQSEMLTLVPTIPVAPALATEQPDREGCPTNVRSCADQHAPGHVETAAAWPKVAPIGAERFLWQLTVGRSAQEKLQHAQELLSHQIPTGDVAQVLERALEELIEKLEKRKFAATRRPCPNRRHSTQGTRHIPADVKRVVWERDGGQCTFVSQDGHRCQARKFLEFDHANPVARGGESTVDGLRLRCRAHNQYAAECAFGTEFMRRKREEAQRAAKERAVAAQARAQAEAAVEEIKQDVFCALRNLGYRADQARHGAAQCDSNPEATFEQRIRVALGCLCPRAVCQRSGVWNPAGAT
jgi:5-methylcytosine-specific restriction endonuclease McrA